MEVQIVRAPAGSGKTQAYIRRIAKKPPGTLIEIYAPTLNLAEEIKRSIEAQGTGHRVVVIKGRDQLGSSGQPLCNRHSLANDVASKGISIFPTLCTRKGPGGPEVCRHYEYCGYISQYQRCNIRIYTHAHLLVARTMLDKDLPQVVVIDEDFALRLIEKVEVSHILIQYVSGIPDCAAAMAAIQAWCQTRDDLTLLSAYQSQNAAGYPWPKLVELLREYRPQISPAEMDHFVAQSVAQHQNVRTVSVLLDHLNKVLSTGHGPSAIDVIPTGLVVHHRHEITRFGDLNSPDAPSVCVVDATISEVLVRQCVPVTTFREMTFPRKALVYQCSDSICSTSSLLSSRQPTADKKIRAQERLGDIQALMDELSASGKKVLVVGPSAITGNPAKGIPSLLTHSSNVELAHFGAIRGLDNWKDCDALVLIGRNEPTAKEVENIARAFFYDDPVPLQLSGQWSSRPEGYWLASGEQLGVEIAAHLDPRVHEVLMQIREAESIQALDRLRLIHNSSPKLVVILSKLPLPGVLVEELMDWKTLTRGTDFERLYRQNGSVLPLNAAWIAHQTGKTVDAAKSAIRRIRGHNLLRFNKWATTLSKPPTEAQYLPVGQRKWSRFWHGLPNLSDAKTALERVIGTQVKVK